MALVNADPVSMWSMRLRMWRTHVIARNAKNFLRAHSAHACKLRRKRWRLRRETLRVGAAKPIREILWLHGFVLSAGLPCSPRIQRGQESGRFMSGHWKTLTWLKWTRIPGLIENSRGFSSRIITDCFHERVIGHRTMPMTSNVINLANDA